MTTAQLARRLLQGQPTGRFVAHELLDPAFPGDHLHAIRFFGRPVSLDGGLCQRDVLYVNLAPAIPSNSKATRQDVPVEYSSTTNAAQLAAARQCRMAKDGFFAWVQPTRALDAAQHALRRLISLRQAARNGAAPVTVTCQTELRVNACDKPAHVLLSSLPLHQVFIIQPRGDGWDFSVMPNGPGKAYWHVSLSSHGIPNENVALVWRMPAPF